MLGKRKLETEGPDKDDNFEDDSPVDMEIVRERMELLPIPVDTFQEIPSDIFDDKAVLKYNDGVEGIKSPKQKTEGPLLESENCMNGNSGIKGSPFLEADKCNRNEAVLSIPYNESAELVPTHHTMSDFCPPDFSIWTVEDDLVLKNAVEAGAALEALAKGAVRFSHRFTVRELRERWHALLYNPEISTKAAASMVEVELSHMGFSKLARSSKLNGRDDTTQKQKLQNVRNQYYQMRKRIDAERILPVEDYSLFRNDTVVICTGNGNEVMQEERAVMYEGGSLAVSIEEAAVAPPFGLSEECLDIEDKAFSQMVNFLASGVLEGDAGAFSSTNMDSLEVNPAPLNLISNGCYDFSGHDPSVMPTVTATDSGNAYISTENIHHLVEDIPQEEVHNSANIHDGSYIIQSSLPLDTITAPIINSEPNMNPVSLVNHNSDTFQNSDGRYNRAEGFEKAVSEENIAASGMLSQPSIGNWEGNTAFLMPSMTVDIKDNADEPILSTEFEATSGPRESVRDGDVMLSSSTTKEKLLNSSRDLVQSSGGKVQHEPQQQPAPTFLPNCREGANIHALGNGQELLCDSEYVVLGAPLKDESHVRSSQCTGNMAPFSNNSAMERTVCLESNGLDVASIPAFTSPVPAQAGQEWKCDAVNAEVLPLNIYANCQPHLFIHGPMDCVLNTEDTNVPDNDEFNPLAYQEPSSISSVVLSSYVEQSITWGSLPIHGNLDNSTPLCKGYPVVKEEPEAIETLVQAANELQPLSFKDNESNKPSSDYQQVKMEILEFTAPAVVSEEVGASNNFSHPGIPSSSVPIALHQGISTVPSMLENCANYKFKVLSSQNCNHAPLHGNDSYVDFTRPLQFEGAPGIQDNIMQVPQVASFFPIDSGLNDFQVTSCEEAAADQFPGNQENKFADSDEELPHFSDVEAMILDMDLDPGDDETFSSRTESKRMYKQHRKVIIRLEQTANSAMQRTLASNGAYAIFYGRYLRYFIKKNEVTIGRVTQENLVDIDLGKEGRANKVSRRQATIRLKEDGLFYLENHGKRAIAVNSRDIMSGQCIRLGSNCLIEVGGMTFIFEIYKRRREQSTN